MTRFMIPKSLARLFVLMVANLIVLPALAQVTSDPFSVTKVDPPSWWTGSKSNPIRLLIQGHRLSEEVEIKADRDGLQITNLRASQNGHYLFADLHIAPNCLQGPVRFEIVKTDSASNLPDGTSVKTFFDWNVLDYPLHQPVGFWP